MKSFLLILLCMSSSSQTEFTIEENHYTINKELHEHTNNGPSIIFDIDLKKVDPNFNTTQALLDGSIEF